MWHDVICLERQKVNFRNSDTVSLWSSFALVHAELKIKEKWKNETRKFNVEWKWCDLCKVFSFGNFRKYARFHQLRFHPFYTYIFKEESQPKGTKVKWTWIFFNIIPNTKDKRTLKVSLLIHIFQPLEYYSSMFLWLTG